MTRLKVCGTKEGFCETVRVHSSRTDTLSDYTRGAEIFIAMGTENGIVFATSKSAYARYGRVHIKVTTPTSARIVPSCYSLAVGDVVVLERHVSELSSNGRGIRYACLCGAQTARPCRYCVWRLPSRRDLSRRFWNAFVCRGTHVNGDLSFPNAFVCTSPSKRDRTARKKTNVQSHLQSIVRHNGITVSNSSVFTLPIQRSCREKPYHEPCGGLLATPGCVLRIQPLALRLRAA